MELWNSHELCKAVNGKSLNNSFWQASSISIDTRSIKDGGVFFALKGNKVDGHKFINHEAHVAYIPKERVVGLSKLARVVEVFSKRLQTQERLTMQIANTLMESLDAKGVAVTIDSTHQCMTMRGIKKEQATTVTNYYLGQFKEDLSFQNRYLRFISTTLKD